MKLQWILTGVGLMIAGCATQGGLSEHDRLVYEGRIDDLEAAQARQKIKIASMDSRILQLEDMIAMLARKGEVREVVRIEPETSAVSSDFNRREVVTPAQEDDLYQDIIIGEEKKRIYFGGSSSSRATTPSASYSNSGSRQAYENVVSSQDKLPSANGANVSAAPTNSTPMLFYQEGIDLYRQGNFNEARTKFEQFLATKPEESYIDNALYWIGECFYGQGLYHEAATYFHRIVQEYPEANKVPDALLKVSLTYQKLGKIDSAKEMLKYLMEAFPNTEAARVGKEKYQSL